MRCTKGWLEALLILVGGFALAGCEGPAGEPGTVGGAASCTVGRDELAGATTITCSDGTVAVIPDGADGSAGSNGNDGSPGADGEGCTAVNNGDGTYDITCGTTTITVSDGSDGTNGTNGDNGSDGADGMNVAIDSHHGEEHLLSTGEFEPCPAGITSGCGKFFVDIEITGATADAAGVATVDFTVQDEGGTPLDYFDADAAGWLNDIQTSIVSLEPPASGRGYSRWVPYIFTTVTVGANGEWPNPAGTSAAMGSQEDIELHGVFTNLGGGAYRYQFQVNLASVTTNPHPDIGAPGYAVTYDRSRLHRVAVRMGGHEGPTGEDTFDFVPDGSAPSVTRDIVQTSACHQCHGEKHFYGHGGDRLTLEGCNTCHNMFYKSPYNDEFLGTPVMIHKIHAGGEVASIPGDDGIVWDDPATVADESADNGRYAIYRNFRGNVNVYEWWNIEFPAVIENCTKCHDGGGADVDAWKTPSRDVCASCHDDVDFTTGTNHPGFAQSSDANCTVCHQADGMGTALSVEQAHDWVEHDFRKQPEFLVNATMTPPANGTHYVAGEAPMVTVVLTKADGSAIDHTTIRQDAANESCPTAEEADCAPADGLFRTFAMFVHGPRARRVPVLTTAARAQIFSSGPGPFDISAASATLVLKVDQGMDTWTVDSSGGDIRWRGTITVTVPATGTFASKAAATVTELAAWLNADAAFRARAIAYVEGGRLGIRSRNLGDVHGVQLMTSVVATQVFAGDLTPKMPLGSTTANSLYEFTTPANNDPKATRFTDRIEYQLDPVDDLVAGTYVLYFEIADRGNTSDTNYKTPSVFRSTFQVKSATEELPPAANCDRCHQDSSGKGYVLDWRRHQKIFDQNGPDVCGNCHDQMPQLVPGMTGFDSGAAGSTAGWTGARPISKRVHAVHYGSDLNNQLATVDYSNGDPVKGRNWNITLPQDVRNCQLCHPAGETSGTWKTKPSRLACWGCHDSDPAQGHFKAMTFDPTPLAPWSGDEVESCATCHVGEN